MGRSARRLNPVSSPYQATGPCASHSFSTPLPRFRQALCFTPARLSVLSLASIAGLAHQGRSPVAHLFAAALGHQQLPRSVAHQHVRPAAQQPIAHRDVPRLCAHHVIVLVLHDSAIAKVPVRLTVSTVRACCGLRYGIVHHMAGVPLAVGPCRTVKRSEEK